MRTETTGVEESWGQILVGLARRLLGRIPLWLAIPLLAAGLFGAGMAVEHYRRGDIFDRISPLVERRTDEMVYARRGLPYSNLFHFADCEYFSDKLYAAGPCWQVFNQGDLKPCPKCAPTTVGADGTTHFLKPTKRKESP